MSKLSFGYDYYYEVFVHTIRIFQMTFFNDSYKSFKKTLNVKTSHLVNPRVTVDLPMRHFCAKTSLSSVLQNVLAQKLLALFYVGMTLMKSQRRYSSEIRGLCLMKRPSKTLQKCCHICWNLKIHILVFSL